MYFRTEQFIKQFLKKLPAVVPNSLVCYHNNPKTEASYIKIYEIAQNTNI